MKGLQQDLEQKKLKPVYVLYGEEAYLKRQYARKLKNACISEEDMINYNKFEGKDVVPREVISLAQTLPFFAEKRLIMLENTGLLKSSCDELADFIPEIPDSVCLVFVEREVDKRTRLFKAVKEKGRASEFKQQDTKTLIKWILGILKKENKKIAESTMNLFLEKTGCDMDNIYQELEKLLCYTIEKDTITSADVEAICTVQVTNRIFDMINAIAEKKQKKALELYYDLLALKEPPMRILFLINRQFHLLMQVKDLLRQQKDKKEISTQTSLHGFVVNKYIQQSKSFTLEQLRQAVEDCIKAETDVKIGNLSDKMSVELLIVKFSI